MLTRRHTKFLRHCQKKWHLVAYFSEREYAFQLKTMFRTCTRVGMHRVVTEISNKHQVFHHHHDDDDVSFILSNVCLCVSLSLPPNFLVTNDVGDDVIFAKFICLCFVLTLST